MADVFTRKKRSAIMALIKGKHTSPERLLRRLLRAQKIRFRCHLKSLPGSPDFVLVGRKTAIFVNGCFWHGHKDCRRGALPTSNVEFWTKKIAGNKRRDRQKTLQLRKLGWKVFMLWTCRNPTNIFRALQAKSSKA